MTSQTGKNGLGRRLTGAVAGGALAGGLMLGFCSATALADPEAPPTPQADAPQTAGDVLAIIEQDYDLGAGGGQLSNLIDDVMRLRSQGFMPSKANQKAIVKALDHRPNQGPLVEALQETLAYQRKIQAQSQMQEPEQNPFVMGANQSPPGQQPDPTNPDNSGIYIGGGPAINQPIGP